MSTELIIILTVLGVGGLIGLFYVSHIVEKQRRQKALLVANLNDHAFRLQRLLDFTPAAYLHKDVRLLILNQIKERLDKLVELAPGNDKFNKKLQSCLAQISEAQNPAANPPPPAIKTPDEANELRTLLQELSKTLESFVQARILPAADAQRHQAFIQSNFIEANLNYLIQLGQVARQEKKPKLAIHHIQKALAEMQKRNQKGQYSARIEQLTLLIEELNQEAGVTSSAKEDNTQSELNNGIEQLSGEDESWKKKYF